MMWLWLSQAEWPGHVERWSVWLAAVAAGLAGLGYVFARIRRGVQGFVAWWADLRTRMARLEAVLSSETGHDDPGPHLSEKVDDVRHQLGRMHRRLDKSDARQAITQSVLEQHVQESRVYLDQAVAALQSQGVELPRPDLREEGNQ